MRQASALFFLLLVSQLASASNSLRIQSVQLGEGRTDEVESWGECIEENAPRLKKTGEIPSQIWISVLKLRGICQEGMCILNKLTSSWSTYLRNADHHQGLFAVQLMGPALYQLQRSIESLRARYNLEKTILNRTPYRFFEGIEGKILAQVYNKIEEQNSLALTLWQKVSQKVQQEKRAIRGNFFLLRDTKLNAKISASQSLNDEVEVTIRTTQTGSAIQKDNLRQEGRRIVIQLQTDSGDQMSLMGQGGLGRLLEKSDLISALTSTNSSTKLASLVHMPLVRKAVFRGKFCNGKPIKENLKKGKKLQIGMNQVNVGASNTTHLRSILKGSPSHRGNPQPFQRHVSFGFQSQSGHQHKLVRLKPLDQ